MTPEPRTEPMTDPRFTDAPLDTEESPHES
mgnify:FL=1